MSIAGIPLPMLAGISAEAAKAGSIPVPGAVVVAPLISSWKNYGSAGGAFTLVGSPTVSTAGASFNGTDQGAVIAAGGSNFTTVARVTPASDIGQQTFIYTTNCGPIGSLGIYGWGFRTNYPNWECVASGILAVQDGPISQSVTRVYTIKKSGATVSFYINGVNVGELSTGGLGDTLMLGGRVYTGVAQTTCKCTVNSVTHYQSDLSPANQALVEAWAASA